MSTIAIGQSRLSRSVHYNYFAILSGLLATLFVGYILLLSLFGIGSSGFLSIVFMIGLPIIDFAVSIIAVRQRSLYSFERQLSYSALAVTSLYFIVALAVPVVLIGFYILYTYIL